MDGRKRERRLTNSEMGEGLVGLPPPNFQMGLSLLQVFQLYRSPPLIPLERQNGSSTKELRWYERISISNLLSMLTACNFCQGFEDVGDPKRLKCIGCSLESRKDMLILKTGLKAHVSTQRHLKSTGQLTAPSIMPSYPPPSSNEQEFLGHLPFVKVPASRPLQTGTTGGEPTLLPDPLQDVFFEEDDALVDRDNNPIFFSAGRMEEDDRSIRGELAAFQSGWSDFMPVCTAGQENPLSHLDSGPEEDGPDTIANAVNALRFLGMS